MARSWRILLIVAAAGMCAPAWSEPAPKPKKGDPNEVVCEKIETIGSRVATKKVCATRAEWAEKRRLDRDAVDQAQRAAHVGCSTINSHTGAPAC
jgi:hypothetical protein